MKNEQNKANAAELRQAAHDWKKRARGAEKRVLELLKEQAEQRRVYETGVKQMAEMLEEADQKKTKLMAEIDNLTDERFELQYELMCVKAHAYDLAFGSATEE